MKVYTMEKGTEGFAVMRFCSIFGPVWGNFPFKLPHSGFTKPISLGYLEIFG